MGGSSDTTPTPTPTTTPNLNSGGQDSNAAQQQQQQPPPPPPSASRRGERIAPAPESADDSREVYHQTTSNDSPPTSSQPSPPWPPRPLAPPEDDFDNLLGETSAPTVAARTDDDTLPSFAAHPPFMRPTLGATSPRDDDTAVAMPANISTERLDIDEELFRASLGGAANAGLGRLATAAGGVYSVEEPPPWDEVLRHAQSLGAPQRYCENWNVLTLAVQSLMCPVPRDWDTHIDSASGVPFYLHKKSREARWDHPRASHFRGRMAMLLATLHDEATEFLHAPRNSSPSVAAASSTKRWQVLGESERLESEAAAVQQRARPAPSPIAMERVEQWLDTASDRGTASRAASERSQGPAMGAGAESSDAFEVVRPQPPSGATEVLHARLPLPNRDSRLHQHPINSARSLRSQKHLPLMPIAVTEEELAGSNGSIAIPPMPEVAAKKPSQQLPPIVPPLRVEGVDSAETEAAQWLQLSSRLMADAKAALAMAYHSELDSPDSIPSPTNAARLGALSSAEAHMALEFQRVAGANSVDLKEIPESGHLSRPGTSKLIPNRYSTGQLDQLSLRTEEKRYSNPDVTTATVIPPPPQDGKPLRPQRPSRTRPLSSLNGEVTAAP